MQEERDKRTHGFKIKRAFKNTFTYGLALEIMFIGSGYLLYREYKTNKQFRDRVEDELPQFTQAFNTISGLYLKVVPENLKDQILNVDGNDSSNSAMTNSTDQNNAPASSTTNSSKPSK